MRSAVGSVTVPSRAGASGVGCSGSSRTLSAMVIAPASSRTTTAVGPLGKLLDTMGTTLRRTTDTRIPSSTGPA